MYTSLGERIVICCAPSVGKLTYLCTLVRFYLTIIEAKQNHKAGSQKLTFVDDLSVKIKPPQACVVKCGWELKNFSLDLYAWKREKPKTKLVGAINKGKVALV